MTHPDDNALQKWLDGDGDHLDVGAHIESCDRCSAVVASAQSTGRALRHWAEAVPVPTDDLADAVMRALEPKVTQVAAVPPPPPEAPSHSARVIPLRRWVWPALAAAAALIVMMSPRIRPTDAPLPHTVEPTPHVPLPAGALALGADVVSVQVEGAKSSTVLEIEGNHPEATSSVVWIQDEPDDPTPEPTAVD